MKTKTNRFIISLGDSLTFGEGLPSGHDYPSILASKLEHDIKVYNFGFLGSSLNDIYLRGLNEKVYEGVTEPDGDIVYVFIYSQFRRYFRSTTMFHPNNVFIQNKHELKWDGENLTDKGPFNKSSDFHFRFLEALSQSKLLAAFNFNWPIYITREQLTDFTKTFLEIKNQIERKRRVNRILVYSLSIFSEEEDFRKILNSNGIEYRNLWELAFHKHLQQPFIPIDKHPTAEFNWMFSEVVIKDLNQ